MPTESPTNPVDAAKIFARSIVGKAAAEAARPYGGRLSGTRLEFGPDAFDREYGQTPWVRNFVAEMEAQLGKR